MEREEGSCHVYVISILEIHFPFITEISLYVLEDGARDGARRYMKNGRSPGLKQAFRGNV